MSLFAGLRSIELQHLDWGSIQPGEFIIMKGIWFKGRPIRRIPIHSNLDAWLKLFYKIRGLVFVSPLQQCRLIVMA